MSRKFFWPILIILSASLAGILAGSSSGGILRPIILMWFILFCPGMAIVRLIRMGDFVFELILSIALSLVLGTLVAEILLITRHWSSPAILAILIIISLTGAILQIILSVKRDVSSE